MANISTDFSTWSATPASNQPDSADTASVQADLQALQAALKIIFPNIGAALTPTHTELNYVDGVTSAIQTQLNAKAASGANSDITSLTALASISGLTGDITGLFSGATIADRVLFKTSTTNDGTVLTLTPNGTSVLSYLELHNSSTPDVASSYTSISVSSGVSALVSGKSGAGSYLPLVFYTSGSEKFRIGTDGQIGLGGANYGSSGEVLTSNGAGSAPTWQAFSGVGVGQTWQNLTGSRSSGVTYTNSTGKPIQVHM